MEELKAIEDFKETLRAGADKISINSAAIRNPQLISDAAAKFGSQCVVVAIDGKKNEDGLGWHVVINGGRIDTGLRCSRVGEKGRRTRGRRNTFNQYGCRWNKKRI